MNGIFEQFPYSNLHNINLDWILKVLKAYGQVIDGLDERITEAIKQGLEDLDIMKLILDAMSEYGLVINVKAPPNGLPSAVGDGSADDTITIQGCIDYASTKGGAVFFPSGKYLTQSLVLKSNVSLVAFDPSSSRLVLKGGATTSMLTGNVKNCTISNITFDGNSAIQVDDIDIIDLTASDLTIDNIRITDGYNLMRIHATGCVRGNLIDFGNAVIDSLITTGVGEVMFSNLIFHNVSALVGRYVINNKVDNATFNNIYSTAKTETAIFNSGDKNAFIGRILKAVNTITDSGTNTYTNFYERGGTGSKGLEKEIQDRIDADNLLRQSIDTFNEKIEILEDAVDKEILDRTNADTVLREDIDQEVIDRTNADATLREDLDQETLDRTNADILLQNNIDAEKLAREQADLELEDKIGNFSNEFVYFDSFPRLVGETDDTKRLQRAIDYATERQMWAVNNVKSKTYYISSPLYLEEYAKVDFGEAWLCKTTNTKGVGGNVLNGVLDSYVVDAYIIMKHRDNEDTMFVNLKNIWFKTTAPNKPQYAVYAPRLARSDIENLWAWYDSADYCIYGYRWWILHTFKNIRCDNGIMCFALVDDGTHMGGSTTINGEFIGGTHLQKAFSLYGLSSSYFKIPYVDVCSDVPFEFLSCYAITVDSPAVEFVTNGRFMFFSGGLVTVNSPRIVEIGGATSGVNALFNARDGSVLVVNDGFIPTYKEGTNPEFNYPVVVVGDSHVTLNQVMLPTNGNASIPVLDTSSLTIINGKGIETIRNNGSYLTTESNTINTVTYGTHMPTDGTWKVNDVFRLTSERYGAPMEYKCIVGGNATTARWSPTNYKVNIGASFARPSVSGVNDIGCMFIDTTLGVNGIPIWWTGTNWINSVGEIV